MSERKKTKSYLQILCSKIIPDEKTLNKIINIKNIIIRAKKKIKSFNFCLICYFL